MEIAAVVERLGRIAEVRATADADAAVLQSGLVAVREARAWLDAQQAGLVAQLQPVSSFPEATIAEADRTSIGAANKVTQRAGTLAATPKLAEALADGAITAGHIDALTRISKQFDADQTGELAKRADALVAVAAAGTVEEFRRRLQLEAKRLQRDDGIDRFKRQRRATRLTTWVDAEGMWNLRGRFDPVTGVKLAAKLDTTVETLFGAATPETAPTDPIEKQHHLRALALARLLDGTVGGGRATRAEFVAVIDADAPGPGPVVDWSIPVEIPARVLAELAGDADTTAVVVRNGVVLYAPGELDLGRWRHGGRTDLANLLPICSKHHAKIHHDGWTIELGPNRELTLTLPDGQIMTTGPPTIRAA